MTIRSFSELIQVEEIFLNSWIQYFEISALGVGVFSLFCQSADLFFWVSKG
jgi:hypothetical protein